MPTTAASGLCLARRSLLLLSTLQLRHLSANLPSSRSLKRFCRRGARGGRSAVRMSAAHRRRAPVRWAVQARPGLKELQQALPQVATGHAAAGGGRAC